MCCHLSVFEETLKCILYLTYMYFSLYPKPWLLQMLFHYVISLFPALCYSHLSHKINVTFLSQSKYKVYSEWKRIENTHLDNKKCFLSTKSQSWHWRQDQWPQFSQNSALVSNSDYIKTILLIPNASLNWNEKSSICFYWTNCPTMRSLNTNTRYVCQHSDHELNVPLCDAIKHVYGVLLPAFLLLFSALWQSALSLDRVLILCSGSSDDYDQVRQGSLKTSELP